MKMQRKYWLAGLFACMCLPGVAQPIGWPKVKTEMKPGARWWWMGSAVNKSDLTYNLEEYVRAGIGTMEITPVYGVQGNEDAELEYLSPRWMEMLAFTEDEAKRLGMNIDMNTGTGGLFGGPEVTIKDAAVKVIFQEYHLKKGERLKEKIEVADEKQKTYATLSCLMAFSSSGNRRDLTAKVIAGKLNWTAPEGEWRLIALFEGKTLQQVKYAAPGGEGYVIDHFSRKAVANYLRRFTKAFETRTGEYAYDAVKNFYKGIDKDLEEGRVAYPHSFFNGSYRVYEADWTPGFLEEFAYRRGYKLEDYLPEFLSSERNDTTARIISDYRETLAGLLQENFTLQWTEWAHEHGSLTRNQAHGSPGNPIDLYATADIPECESFGISDFHINGLRKDSLTCPDDMDVSMLKFASSAAHIAGKPYTSSETFTWLTEHFRTSLSQCKPDLDKLFVSGVNRIFIQGTAYSPQNADWPGWKFHTAIDMSPTNSIWRDAPAFFDYVTRCQSFLQTGKPDNDFLIYFPVYDVWHEQDGRMLRFDSRKMTEYAPRFMETVHKISDAGYGVDYISDNFIRSAQCVNGKLVTKGGAVYQAIIIPAAKKMPEDVLKKLLSLAQQGAQVIFLEAYPESVPGFSSLRQRTKAFNSLLDKLPAIEDFKKVKVTKTGKGKIITGTDYAGVLAATGIQEEKMKTDYGLRYIRCSNETGYHYFIASLQEKDVNGYITLAVPAVSAVIYDPMTGEIGKAEIKYENGKTQVWLDIKSGQSLILKTFTRNDVNIPRWKYKQPQTLSLSLDNGWTLRFVKSEPRIDGMYEIDRPIPWTSTSIPDARRNMGTGIYTLVFDLPDIVADDWILDLGDVRESARVRINDREAGTVWAVPFTIAVGKYLRPGSNQLEVEVTNLPANRIADYDRRGIKWRKFKEINIVDRNYKKTNYAGWETVPSGLMGTVKLIPVNYK